MAEKVFAHKSASADRIRAYLSKQATDFFILALFRPPPNPDRARGISSSSARPELSNARPSAIWPLRPRTAVCVSAGLGRGVDGGHVRGQAERATGHCVFWGNECGRIVKSRT